MVHTGTKPFTTSSRKATTTPAPRATIKSSPWSFALSLLGFSVLLIGCQSAPGIPKSTEPASLEPRNVWEAGPEAANELLKQRVEIYDELANPKVDPYFGELRSAAECDEGSIPNPKSVTGEEGTGRLYHFYSGGEGSLKVCDPKHGRKTQVLFLFCKQDGKLYEYRQHYDFKAKWKEAPIVTCRK